MMKNCTTNGIMNSITPFSPTEQQLSKITIIISPQTAAHGCCLYLLYLFPDAAFFPDCVDPLLHAGLVLRHEKLTGLFTLYLAIIFNADVQTRTAAQQLLLTNEDSLNAGATKSKTVVSGLRQRLIIKTTSTRKSGCPAWKSGTFIGHQFNSKIAFSEMEIEMPAGAAKVAGEISMEQAYLKFNLNSRQYLRPDFSFHALVCWMKINLPVNFNGVLRPVVEQLIIPTTWRELGIDFTEEANAYHLTILSPCLMAWNAGGF